MNTQLEDDPAITTATVMFRRSVTRGDRVKHYGQRYRAPTGTATVVGFHNVRPGSQPWIKVIVEPDNPDSAYGNTWDWDRTEVVEQ